MNFNSETPLDPFQISIPFLTQSTSSNNPSDKKLAFTSSLPTSIQSNSNKAEEHTSPYFVTAFNITSYIGFVPFKVVKSKSESNDGSGSEYTIVPLGLVRKIFCFLIHLNLLGMNLYGNVVQLIFSDPSQFSSNFTRTFDMVANVGIFFLSISFIYTCWIRQDELLEIIQQTSVNYDKGSERKHQFITIIMILISYAISLYIVISLVPYPFPWTESPWSWPTSEGTTIPDYILKIGTMFYVIFFYHSMSVQHYCSTFMAFMVLSVRGVRKTFCERMTTSLEKTDLDSGFDHYISLKQLTSNITRTFGTMILFYYIVSVAYFAKIPESSVWKSNVRIVGMLSYFGFGAVVWLVSAEFHMNVRDVVQNWATQMQDLDDLTIDTRIRLLNVVNDNLLDPVGISCKFFTITYGFLGSMLGLIVTYAIIVFQMQAKPNSNVTTTPSTLLSTVATTTRNTEL